MQSDNLNPPPVPAVLYRANVISGLEICRIFLIQIPALVSPSQELAAFAPFSGRAVP